MQTFLPHRNFEDSARCLDYRRLGKQRVEAWQILQCLLGKGSLHWKNHPAVKMWKGYESTLCRYGIAICEEWKSRGYQDTLLDRFKDEYYQLNPTFILPDWLTEEFCKRHRSNLLRKNKEYYSQFNWKVPDDLEYIWLI